MKIGILSDSHSRVDLAGFCIKKLKKEGADFIIHAGDIVKEETLKLLKKSDIPYKAIIGNNDLELISVANKYELFSEPYTFKVKKYKIKLMHHPYYLSPNADIVIFGHTHKFEAKKTQKTLYINPGEVCGRKNKQCECVLLKLPEYKLTRFYAKIDKLKWHEECKKYD